MKKTFKLIIMVLYIAILIFVMMINKLLIHLVQFKKLSNVFSSSNQQLHKNKVSVLGKKIISLTKKSFYWISKYSVWKPKCFEQSLTVLLVGRIFKIDSSIYFGIMKNPDGKLCAHSWSKLGNVYISGYETSSEFSIVYELHNKY